MNVGLGTIVALVGLGSTLIGGCIALVNLGIRVGKITSKVDELDNDNFKFGKNNQEKFNFMNEQNHEQSQSIALLKQSLETMAQDIKDIKEELSGINTYIRQAESARGQLESRVEYLERQAYGGKK